MMAPYSSRPLPRAASRLGKVLSESRIFRAMPVMLLAFAGLPGTVTAQVQTWSPPVSLRPDGATDTSQDQIYARPVAGDGRGNWVSVWQGQQERRVLAARSSDHGTTWSAPVTILDSDSTSPHFIAYPSLATDKKGTWITVWAEQDDRATTPGDESDIFFSRSTDNGASWSPPAPVTRSAPDEAPAIHGLPTIAADGAGNWVITWHSRVPYADLRLFATHSSDHGLTWAPPAPLGPGIVSYGFRPVVTAAGTNRFLTAAHGGIRNNGVTSAGLLLLRSTDAGSTWTAPYFLDQSVSVDPGVDPELRADSEGNVLAAFDRGSRNWYLTRSEDGGESWSTPYPFPRVPVGSYQLRLAPGPGKTWVASWGSGAEDWQNPTSHLRYINYAVSVDEGGTWRPDQGTVVWGEGNSLQAQGFPGVYSAFSHALASDETGRWVCCFQFTGKIYDKAISTLFSTGPDYDVFTTTFRLPDRARPATAAFLDLINRNGRADSGNDLQPEIAADRLGQRVAVWQSNDSLSGTKGTDADILVSRSTDSAQGWSPPTVLSSHGTTDTQTDWNPRIATDGKGTWLACWNDGTFGGGSVGKIAYAWSTNAGKSWTPARLLGPPDSRSDGLCSVATDGHGVWMVFASEGVQSGIGQCIESRLYVYRSWDNGQTWTTRVEIGSGTDARAATDGAGNWIVTSIPSVFCPRSYPTQNSVLVNRSVDGGKTWSGSTFLAATEDISYDTFSDIATDGHGSWMIVWNEDPGSSSFNYREKRTGDVFFSRSGDNGQTWSAPSPIYYGAAGAPRLVSEGPGRWLCVWDSLPWLGFLPTERDIVLSRTWDNGASWSEPLRLNQGPVYNTTPAVALDAHGQPVIAWSGKGSGEGGADFDIWFATAASTSFTGASDWQLFE